jgi:glycosyltransferase involved in cell wall biosynthesis
MKIGIDIRTLTDEKYSGVSAYTNNLVQEILRQDKLNEYKLYYNCARDLSFRLPKFEQSNVEVIKTSYPNKIFNYLFQKLLHYPKFDDIVGGTDIFWAPHINFISLSSGTKKAITIHDLSFWRYPKFFTWRKNFWHKMIGIKKLLNDFEAIIAVSENTKQDIIELGGVSPDKVTVVYSGLNERYQPLDSGHPDLERVKAKHKLDSRFILFLGTLEPRKNVQGIIEAYNRLRSNDVNGEFKDLKLVLAGATGWKFGGIYEEYRKSPYKADIKLLGYVDGADKPALYNLASAFVYPSFYEGFGFPPLEAMACGVPVITSAVSSLPEIAGDSALLVDPYNLGFLSEAIVQVLRDKDLADSLRQKGLENAKRFSWQKAALQYLELFKKLGESGKVQKL